MNCLECLGQWRGWIRPLVIGLYASLLLIALPLLIVEFQQQGTDTHLQAWFIGGMFVLMAVPISLWGILQHLIHYTQPFLQRYIIRILWMVPIYAVNAWFALRFKQTAIYLDTLRECYEAYVIYNFMAFLLTYLHSEYPNLEASMEQKPQVKHIIPFCCLPPWKMGGPLIQYCKHGALQYTVIRPITTVIALICQLCGKYQEGDFNLTSAWTYLVIINNISQIWAMYCLVLFYKATKEELAPIKPVYKFMCVKAVVFMSFWQSVVIAALVELKVIKQDSSWVIYTIDDVSAGLQDFCICIEMFFAALAHYFSFSHKPYIDYAAGQADCCSSFAHMWDVSDVREDVIAHVRHVGKTVTRPLRPGRGHGKQGDSERTPLLQDNQESSEEDPSRGPPRTPPVILGPNDIHTIMVEAHNFGGDTVAGDNISEAPSDLPGSYSRRSFTASMNNFAEFSESTDTESRGTRALPESSAPYLGTKTCDGERLTADATTDDLVDLTSEFPSQDSQDPSKMDTKEPTLSLPDEKQECEASDVLVDVHATSSVQLDSESQGTVDQVVEKHHDSEKCHDSDS